MTAEENLQELRKKEKTHRSFSKVGFEPTPPRSLQSKYSTCNPDPHRKSHSGGESKKKHTPVPRIGEESTKAFLCEKQKNAGAGVSPVELFYLTRERFEALILGETAT